MQITIPLNEIWIVHATSGRFNGSAFIRATSKKEANERAEMCGWLVNGRVVKKETRRMMDWYEHFEQITNVEQLYDNFITEKDVNAINNMTEVGMWHEIEWGC